MKILLCRCPTPSHFLRRGRPGLDMGRLRSPRLRGRLAGTARPLAPTLPAAGKPWIWRTEFFGHEPQADLALLAQGFHVVYVNVQNMYGAPVRARSHGCVLRSPDQATRPWLPKPSSKAPAAVDSLPSTGPHVIQIASPASTPHAPVCTFKSWPWRQGQRQGISCGLGTLRAAKPMASPKRRPSPTGSTLSITSNRSPKPNSPSSASAAMPTPSSLSRKQRAFGGTLPQAWRPNQNPPQTRSRAPSSQPGWIRRRSCRSCSVTFQLRWGQLKIQHGRRRQNRRFNYDRTQVARLSNSVQVEFGLPLNLQQTHSRSRCTEGSQPIVP